MREMLYDRLYGKITFSSPVRALLTCPGLLRLRGVRLGNVQFFAFPSFAGCSRYEHSIGVCHLAELAAERLELGVKEKTELMIACLYHDAATPPFAHTMEDILKQKFGFDHEQHLYELLTGKSDDVGKSRAQVFQGRSLKLFRVIDTAQSQDLGLDLSVIADTARGKGPLGSLVKSSVDLDNIDNVVRASSALGFQSATREVAESLALGFLWSKNGTITLSERSREFLIRWQRLRHNLYTLIYDDIEDFSIDTMIKHALRILTRISPDNGGITKWDWCLTEDQLLNERFMLNKKTQEILHRISFIDVYPCIALIDCWATDKDIVVVEFLKKFEIVLKDFLNMEVIVNHFFDTRRRTRPSLESHPPLTAFLPRRSKGRKVGSHFIVGVFTPAHFSEIKRKLAHVSISDFKQLIDETKTSNYRVHITRFIKNPT